MNVPQPLPWICVLSADEARFQLRAFSSRDHYPHSVQAGKSDDQNNINYSPRALKVTNPSGTHRVGRKAEVDDWAVKLQQIQQFIRLQRP